MCVVFLKHLIQGTPIYMYFYPVGVAEYYPLPSGPRGCFSGEENTFSPTPGFSTTGMNFIKQRYY